MILASSYGALWVASLALAPVAILAAALCCMGVRRPATRHALYVAVLVCFTAPLLASVGIRATLPDANVLTRIAPVSEPVPAAPEVLQSDVPIAPVAKPMPRSRPQREQVDTGGWASRRSMPSSRRAHSDPVEPGKYRTLERFTRNTPKRSEQPAPIIAPTPQTTIESTSPSTGALLMSSLRDSASAWRAGFFDVRNAIIALPPMPPFIWLGGIGVFGLAIIFRMMRQAWFIRSATPAPAEVRAMARQAAALVGLPKAPPVRFTTRRSSPLVTCGARVCVVLPAALWEELDDASRRAVLVHELAHLRRRDHWVRRLELLIGTAYWWHPVMWWVRKRLNEEADLACDVWVTTLLPHCRRAYAEALVRTTTYVGGNTRRGGRVPVAALGMATGPARRFGRRITMVMTERSRRRPSILGGAMCAAIAAIGMVVMPALACPDADEPAEPTKYRVQEAPETPEYSTTFDRFMGEGDRTDAAEARGAFEHRMKQLERELVEAGRLMGLKAREMKFQGREFQAAPEPPKAPRAEAPSAEQITLHYHLPKGKLGPMTGLMSRSDVPILITPGDDKITVHATIPQHRVFYSFCVLINPDGIEVTNEEGNSVRFKHHTSEHDAALKGKVAKAPKAPKARGRGIARDPAPRAVRIAPQARQGLHRDMQRKVHEELSRHRAQASRQIESHRRALHEHQRAAEQLYRRAERAHRRSDQDESAADAAEDRIESLHEEIERLHEMLEGLHERHHDDGADDRTLKATKAKSIATKSKIERMQREAMTLEHRAAETLADAELAMAEADKLEMEAESAEELAEQIEEAIEEAMESWEEAMESFEEEMADFQIEMQEMDDHDEEVEPVVTGAAA